MIYITGDTHGSQRKWIEQIDPMLGPKDILIVAGDFGVGFWDGCFWPEEMFYDYIAQKEYTVLFADGNHENFKKLSGMAVERWNGGRVHRLRPNLIHLMRGEIYQIEGKSLFVFGGGFSRDYAWRQENISWWPQEMPDEKEYQNAWSNLEAAGNEVDYILTHTAPSQSITYLSTLQRLGIRHPSFEELPLNTFLDEIQRRIRYKNWYFGHFHVDVELWRNQTALFNTLRRLEDGKIVRRWDSYEG